MGRGEHIYVNHVVFTHHGIDCGDGSVIHHPGGLLTKANKVISRTSLDKFADGKQIFVRNYFNCGSPNVVIQRAESQLNTAGYNLFENNCEHFATWCKTGNKKSQQVEHPILSVSENVLVAVENSTTVATINFTELINNFVDLAEFVLD